MNNDERANIIADAISTIDGRTILSAEMWFPMEMPEIGETKLQWAKRKLLQLEDEVEQFKTRKK
jgi:hypothetical protein